MTKALIAGALALALAAGASAASAAVTINISTGLDSSGNVQSVGDAKDANWTVTGAVNPKSGTNAYTVFPNDADWYGGWLSNDGSSDWIAGNPDDRFGNGLLSFTRTFTVGSTVGASMTGSFSIDDDGYVALNGNILATTGGGGWGAMHSFTANASQFVTGVNTLTLVMGHTDTDFEAGRVTGTATFEAPVKGGAPEPAAWALMIVGLGGAGAMLRRRRTAAALA